MSHHATREELERAGIVLSCDADEPASEADHRYQEGRKAGLREAAAHIDWTVENLRAARRSADCGPVHRTWFTDAAVRDELERHAAELRVMAGEP